MKKKIAVKTVLIVLLLFVLWNNLCYADVIEGTWVQADITEIIAEFTSGYVSEIVLIIVLILFAILSIFGVSFIIFANLSKKDDNKKDSLMNTIKKICLITSIVLNILLIYILRQAMIFFCDMMAEHSTLWNINLWENLIKINIITIILYIIYGRITILTIKKKSKKMYIIFTFIIIILGISTIISSHVGYYSLSDEEQEWVQWYFEKETDNTNENIEIASDCKIIVESSYENYAWGAQHYGTVICNDGSVYTFDCGETECRTEDLNETSTNILNNITSYKGKIDDEDLEKIKEYSQCIEEYYESDGLGGNDMGTTGITIYNYELNKRITLKETGDNERHNTSEYADELLTLIEECFDDV